MSTPLFGCRRFMLAVLFVLIAGGPFAATAQNAGDSSCILNENAFWHRYYRFETGRVSAAALKSDGDKTLGAQRLNKLQRNTEKEMQAQGKSPAAADWREFVCPFVHGGNSKRDFIPVPAPMPPADWSAAGFDDAAWVCEQGPFQGETPAQITKIELGQFDESVDLRLQSAFYRARFVVEDPQRASALNLRLVYSGGARVLLNGEEVGRGHLPAGELAADACGDDYPAKAYDQKSPALRERTLGPIMIPAAKLRKGVNVLAIDLRASRMHPIVFTSAQQFNWGGPQRPWPHARLIKVELRPAGAAIPSTGRRPAGVQAWVADMHHRTLSSDFLPPGEEPGTVRLVGARNGTYAAQVVIGSDKALGDVALAVEDLPQDGGSGRLAAAALQVQTLLPYPLNEWTMKRLGDERGLAASFPDNNQLARYAGTITAAQPVLFDELAAYAPVAIPAGTCRPFWLSLRIPADAAAGRYRGKLTVTARGGTSISLPLEVEVLDWNLPAPKDFKTVVGCEENPYAVAKQYGVTLWSDPHFKLLEASFQQLARIGDDWLNVPVILHTEFGNKEDSPIRWVAKGKGFTFDYTRLDRYLDLAVRCGVQPRVIQFVVMHGCKGANGQPSPAQVKVDTGFGQPRLLDFSKTAPAEASAAWTAFAGALYAHMKERGQEKLMYWGAPLESEMDPGLKTVLAAAAPEVFWTAGPHEMMYNGKYAKDEKFYKIITDIRYQGGWQSFRDDQGWKSKTLHLLNPRVGGTALGMHTTSRPFVYRLLPERALTMGRSGFTRVGADEWAAAHYDGVDIGQWLTGMPVLFTLWPGEQGAQPSVRFEAMLEGIQATEARIYLEQALDGGRVPAALAGQVRKMLNAQVAETSFFEGNSVLHTMEEYHYHWQERSRALYQAAADVAAAAKRTP